MPGSMSLRARDIARQFKTGKEYQEGSLKGQ